MSLDEGKLNTSEPLEEGEVPQDDTNNESIQNDQNDPPSTSTGAVMVAQSDAGSGKAAEPPSAPLRLNVLEAETYPGAVAVPGIGNDHSSRNHARSGTPEDDMEVGLVQAELVRDDNDDKPLAVAVSMTPNRTRNKLLAGAGILVVLVLVVVLVVVLLPRSNNPEQLLTDEPAQIGNTIMGAAPNDWFGGTMSMSRDGSILAVGARYNGDVGFESGLVRVFRDSPSSYDNSTRVWTQWGNAIGGRAPGDQFAFSGVALNHNGTILAVGAPQQTSDSNQTQAGSVRVFEFQTQPFPSWVQVGPDLEGLNVSHMFGRAVAMSADGSIVAGSSYQSSEHGENSAHIRVFRRDKQQNNNTWMKMGNTILGSAAFDRMGRSLAMSANGHWIVAGATQFGGDGQGYIRVFQFQENNSMWTQVGQDVWGDNSKDNMGRDVAISEDGSIFACSANFADEYGEASGIVRVYHLVSSETANSTGSWRQLGQTIAGTGPGHRMGTSIDLSSDGMRLAVGACQESTRASPKLPFQESSGPGYVQVYDYNTLENEWDQVGRTFQGVNLDDQFGTEVQLSANGLILAVGSQQSDANGENSGLVKVFDLRNI